MRARTDDRSAVISAIARIAKYLVGREKQRALKEDTTWFAHAAAPAEKPAEAPRPEATEDARPFRVVQPEPKDRYRTCLPLLPLKAAAGFFSESQAGVELGSEEFGAGEIAWVEIDGRTKPGEGLFVAQVVGESMNRRIPNGAWCVWRANPTGTRNGSVVIAEHPDIDDADLVGRYTVKVYESEKVADADDGWRHARVILKPDSTDSTFQPLVLENLTDGDLRIIAEMVELLK